MLARNYFGIIGVVLLSLLTLSCSDKTIIEGKVEDFFGKPLDGVTVSIYGSSLQTTTNERGEYQISYVLGKFNLVFSKEGCTSDTLHLELSEKVNYPASTIKLFQVPPHPGIYFCSDSGYVKLEKRGIEKETYKDWQGQIEFIVDRVLGEPQIIITKHFALDTLLKFVDTTPQKLFLANVGWDGSLSSQSFKRGRVYTQSLTYVNEERQTITKGVILRTAKLTQQRYFYVSNYDGYYFEIIPAAKNEKSMMMAESMAQLAKKVFDALINHDEKTIKNLALKREHINSISLSQQSKQYLENSIEGFDGRLEEIYRVPIMSVWVEGTAAPMNDPDYE